MRPHRNSRRPAGRSDRRAINAGFDLKIAMAPSPLYVFLINLRAGLSRIPTGSSAHDAARNLRAGRDGRRQGKPFRDTMIAMPFTCPDFSEPQAPKRSTVPAVFQPLDPSVLNASNSGILHWPRQGRLLAGTRRHGTDRRHLPARKLGNGFCAKTFLALGMRDDLSLRAVRA